MEKKNSFRSDCPISSALDIVGDKWSLLILRDILMLGKRTFKEFSNADEHISSSILANRLSKLEEFSIICKRPHATNKKVFEYFATELGADFVPVLVEYILWSNKHYQSHIAEEAHQFALQLKQNKEQIISQIIDSHKSV